jgi:hypothetical protein
MTDSQPVTDPLDPRVKCVDCRNFRPSQCGNWQKARLMSPSVGQALSELPQRCPAHVPKVPA